MRPTTDIALRLPFVSPRVRASVTRRANRLTPEARWLWLAVLVFVCVSFWWLTQDDRIPDFDSGMHMTFAYSDYTAIKNGHIFTPFTTYNTYPPLVHLVGAFAIFIFGMHLMALTMMSNLVFVPLMAFGCYGTGKLIAGPRAGLLAGLFALGTPMFASMMHNFDLDPPEAAMVAVSVWALLASRRFERIGVSAAAGALCGLALLTKETALVFVAGLILTMLARGGWRNWRGLLAFVAVLENVAGPWYVYHATQLSQTFTQIGQLYVSPVQSPPRVSLANLGWYFWNLINNQVGFPFTVAFLVGAVLAIRHWVRDRHTDSYLPELLVGVLVSYLGMTYLTHKDPRYTLPWLVYVAVLATYWILTIRRPRLRIGLAAAVVIFAVINFAGMSFGIGGRVRAMIPLPGAKSTMVYPWRLTVYQSYGWLRGGPAQSGDVLNLLKSLRAMGFTGVDIDSSANTVDFSVLGLIPVAEDAGLFGGSPPGRGLAHLLLHTPRAGDPPPCQRINTGQGIYVVEAPYSGLDATTLRNLSRPSQQYRLVCPGRPVLVWPTGG